jgi:hypothetical protein
MRGTAGHGDRSVPGVARKSEHGLAIELKNIVRETSLRTLCPLQDARAGFLTS